MGLLDWLTEGIGSSMGGSSMPPDLAGGPDAMPPVQPPGVDMPPPIPQAQPRLDFQRPEFANPRLPPGSDPMTAGGDTPNGLGLPPPPVPMPRSDPRRPPLGGLPPLPQAAPSGPGLPPNLPPSAGADGAPLAMSDRPLIRSYGAPGMPGAPGAPTSLAPDTPGSSAGPAGNSFLGRALGLDANKERSMLGGLGAAMTAAGNSAGKTKGQAFFSGVGAGLQGSEKTEQELNKEQQGYLKNAISAMQAGNTAEATKSLVQLRIAQTQKAQQEAIDLAQGSGKDNVANSRQQLILRADKQALGEAQVSANGVKQALTAAGGDLNDPTYKKALAEHNDRLDAIKQQKYKELGITPKEAEKLGKMQGMSLDNPAQPKTLADMQKLPVGAYYIPSPGAPPLVKLSPEQLAARKAAAAGGAAGAIPAIPTAPAAPTNPEAADDEYQHAL